MRQNFGKKGISMRTFVRNQLLLNDGSGNRLPIQTGTFVTSAVNIIEQRRVSITVGLGSSTGAVGDAGGFTGVLLVQGTNELAQTNGGTGTQEAGQTNRPGTNGYTGAVYWQTIVSGTINITNATNALLLDYTDVGPAFIRVAFNVSATGSTATGTLGGSGTMKVFLTAKSL